MLERTAFLAIDQDSCAQDNRLVRLKFTWVVVSQNDNLQVSSPGGG